MKNERQYASPGVKAAVREIADGIYQGCGENNAEAARTLGIDDQTLRRILQGDGFNIEQLERMCAELGGPIEFFRLHPTYGSQYMDISLVHALRISRRLRSLRNNHEAVGLIEHLLSVLESSEKNESSP